MKVERKAEAFLGLLVAILFITGKWEDSPTGKLVSIVVSAAGLIGVILLRRHLARVWIEIYTITFLVIALVLLFSLLFPS